MIVDFLNTVDEHGRVDTLVVERIQDLRDILHGENKLNLVHLNIRSIGKIFEEFGIYLDEIDKKKH